MSSHLHQNIISIYILNCLFKLKKKLHFVLPFSGTQFLHLMSSQVRLSTVLHALKEQYEFLEYVTSKDSWVTCAPRFMASEMGGKMHYVPTLTLKNGHFGWHPPTQWYLSDGLGQDKANDWYAKLTSSDDSEETRCAKYALHWGHILRFQYGITLTRGGRIVWHDIMYGGLYAKRQSMHSIEYTVKEREDSAAKMIFIDQEQECKDKSSILSEMIESMDDLLFAFAMGSHERLGASSILLNLPPEIFQKIQEQLIFEETRRLTNHREMFEELRKRAGIPFFRDSFFCYIR